MEHGLEKLSAVAKADTIPADPLRAAYFN